MRAPILYFLLLILEISLNLGPDVSYKQGRFSKTLSKKGLKFVLSKKDGSIAPNLGLILLPAEIDPISEKQSYEENTLGSHDTGRIKMIFTLSTKVVVLHIGTIIV